jgi:hypothetical protein
VIEFVEITLALWCWSVGFLIYFYLMPMLRARQPWHVSGLNFLGAFAGYLGFEIIADSAWIDGHYPVYLIGNGLFPLAATVVAVGYWRSLK